MSQTNYSYGVWLVKSKQWAVLPDRMKKPTWHNTDQTTAGNHAAALTEQGVECEVREIPANKLKEFRAYFAKAYK